MYFFWLGWEDLNPRMTESESVALPLGDTPRAALILMAIKAQVKKKYTKKSFGEKFILLTAFASVAC